MASLKMRMILLGCWPGVKAVAGRGLARVIGL